MAMALGRQRWGVVVTGECLLRGASQTLENLKGFATVRASALENRQTRCPRCFKFDSFWSLPRAGTARQVIEPL